MYKTCIRCNVIKHAVEEFHMKHGKRRTVCKDCANRKAREWAKANPDKVASKQRKATMKFLYGITQLEYLAMLEGQGKRCALCKGTDSHSKISDKLFIDHDHATGKIRGLICHRCNCGLAALGDNPEGLLRAYEYVIGNATHNAG